MNNLTDVVKQLIIINAILFLGTNLPMLSHFREYFILFPPHTPYFKPVQLVTHMFMHADMGHLFFNMLTLYFFGPMIERLWGAKKFLFYYMICGLGAMALHLLIGGNAPVLGASGAISGVVLAFAMQFPDTRIMLLIPPIPMKAKYMVLIFLGIDLFLGLSNYNTGIAHFAHLGGALFGFLLIMIWRKIPFRM